MTSHLVTFSDESMSRSRELCVESAKRCGVDEEWQYDPQSILSSRHYAGNEAIFSRPEDPRRAWGWWAWKPVIIEDAMRRAVECYSGEQYVIYADAGIEFINNVSYIIDRMDQDIFLFGNNWEHAHWCKRDVVDAVWPLPIDRRSFIDAGVQMSTPSNLVAFDVDSIESLYIWARFGKQAQASVIFFRVSDYTRKFVKEWLDWCLSGARIGAALTFGKDNPEHRDERATWSEFRSLIDDSPSVLPNHPEFREHRHDQAILTTMAYREGLKLHYWPAVYNKGGSPEFIYEKLPEYAGDDYPVLFSHHRKRNHEWSEAA